MPGGPCRLRQEVIRGRLQGRFEAGGEEDEAFVEAPDQVLHEVRWDRLVAQVRNLRLDRWNCALAVEQAHDRQQALRNKNLLWRDTKGIVQDYSGLPAVLHRMDFQWPKGGPVERRAVRRGVGGWLLVHRPLR